jgi:hypothetical protein
MWVVSGDNKAYLGLHVNCPTLFTYFNKILTDLTDYPFKDEAQTALFKDPGPTAQ